MKHFEPTDDQDLVNPQELPIEFYDRADFLPDGKQLEHFGELYSNISEPLFDLCTDNQPLKDFLNKCLERFLEGDMGELEEKEYKKCKRDFHEGLSTYAVYKTDLIEEGEVMLVTEGLDGDFENPRIIWFLLPSENQLLEDYLNNHPEEA